MVRKKPINCPHCYKFSGYYEEDLMFMVLTHSIKCPHCGEVVIYGNGNIEYSSMQNPNQYTTPQSLNINTDLKID